MCSTADLTFHIIYTPGTFFYLRLFLFSLLKWSDCSFRLVTNGCDRKEREMVEFACRANSRLEYFHFSQRRMTAKGKVLTALQKIERSRFFCCLDSDIFAVGPFLGEIESDLGRHAAVFSAPHFLMPESGKTMPPGCTGAYGIHVNDPAGQCIGTTCFAVYENRMLDRAIRGCGIDFAASVWAQVPEGYRHCFSRRGLQVEEYDSGKILNTCMSCDGESLVYRNLPMLRHIGGFSFAKTGRQESAARSNPRDLRADYFYELLRALFSGKELPPIPANSNRVSQPKYHGIIGEIITLFENFQGLLWRGT